MAKAKRVFEIAKQLEVKSKAILEKCQAEGIPDMNNHMSSVSAGLEATIHEWFSKQQSGTAIETAAAVDLEKVRVAPKKKKAKAKKKPAPVTVPDDSRDAIGTPEFPIADDGPVGTQLSEEPAADPATAAAARALATKDDETSGISTTDAGDQPAAPRTPTPNIPPPSPKSSLPRVRSSKSKHPPNSQAPRSSA